MNHRTLPFNTVQNNRTRSTRRNVNQNDLPRQANCRQIRSVPKYHPTNSSSSSIPNGCGMEWTNEWNNHQKHVGCGLRNLGNSCFMNSVIQCLAYLPLVTQLCALSAHRRQCSTQEFCLFCELEYLLPRMVLGHPNQPMSPRTIFENLSLVSPILEAGEQQDAHEFFQLSIARLEDEFDGVNSKNNKNNTNVIRNAFGGVIESCTECQECGFQSFRSEPFTCLTVDMSRSLQDSLAKLCEVERLSGENAYACDLCGTKQEALRQMKLLDCPRILAVHVKRFETLFLDGFLETLKNDDRIAFPIEFEMSEQWTCDTKKNGRGVGYELCGAIVHKGKSAYSGHYYAIVKGLDGRFYKMDDSYVREMAVKELMREEVYMLFYKRRVCDGDESGSLSSPSSPSLSLSCDEMDDEDNVLMSDCGVGGEVDWWDRTL